MILLVNQLVTPVFLDIANAFAATGEKVVLFTGSIDKGGASLSPSVKVVSSVRYARLNTLTRLITWLAFTVHLRWFLLTRKRPSQILVVTNPPVAPWVIYRFSIRNNVPFYLLVYDLYPDALNTGGFSDEGGFIYRRWAKINKRMFTGARKIFTLSNSMKKAVESYVQADRVMVINNWADHGYIKPIEKHLNPFAQKQNLQNKIVVLYAGNMGLTHDLESLAEAACILKEENDIAFVFIGDGGKRDILIDICRKNKASNVTFLPHQSSADFPFAIASADIGVVTLGVRGEGISVPSKTYVNMAAGLCLLVIAPKDSEVSRVVGVYNAGVNIEPGDPKEVARTLREIARDKSRLETFKANAIKASKNFTPANASTYVTEILGER